MDENAHNFFGRRSASKRVTQFRAICKFIALDKSCVRTEKKHTEEPTLVCSARLLRTEAQIMQNGKRHGGDTHFAVYVHIKVLIFESAKFINQI